MTETHRQQRLTRDIRLLNTAKAAHNAIFIMPVMVPYYQHQIGLTFQQLLLGEAIFAIVIVAMEVPSGWLADIWRRKSVLQLGFFLNTASWLLLWQADGFWMAIMAQALIGVGISFISGADVALLYDRLAEEGESDKFRRLEGQRHGLGLYGLAAASIVGGMLYVVMPALPILLTALMEFIAGICAIFVTEPGRQMKAATRNPLLDIVETARDCFRQHPELLFLYLFVAVTFAVTISGHWIQQPYYAYLGIPIVWYGWLGGVGFLMGGLSGTFGHHLERFCSRQQVLYAAAVFMIIAYGVSGLFPGIHGIPLLLAGGVVWGITGPMFQAIANDRIKAERRATMLSLSSFGVRLTFVPVSLMVGWAHESWDITVAISGLPFLLIVFSLPLLVFFGIYAQRQLKQPV
jgi:MFS family permease